MTRSRTLLFFTSVLLLACVSVKSQNTDSKTKIDTVSKSKKYYGLRVGIDLSMPIRSFIDANYKGLGVVGDFRIRKNYYIAAALGTETRTIELPNIENTTQGSYIKAGFNYNAYENWYGMNNLLYAGLYAGFSNFNQTLDSYTIYTTTSVFENDKRIASQEFKNLNAAWLELKIGIEVELFSNLYLGLNAQLKRSMIAKEPDGYTNLYIPDFGKVTEDNTIGVGYGYTLSYLIPFSKQ